MEGIMTGDEPTILRGSHRRTEPCHGSQVSVANGFSRPVLAVHGSKFESQTIGQHQSPKSRISYKGLRSFTVRKSSGLRMPRRKTESKK
jgi:hypothetical protein